jgi:hypothetical protein
MAQTPTNASIEPFGDGRPGLKNSRIAVRIARDLRTMIYLC